LCKRGRDDQKKEKAAQKANRSSRDNKESAPVKRVAN
jgi:hypothetical protein